MPRVKLPATPNPLAADPYPNTQTKRGRAMLFQVTDPRNQPIWPYMLALHMNPSSLDEKYTKTKSVAQTFGGYVEWIWPDELDTLSAQGSTGAFIGPDTGLVSGSDGKGAFVGGVSSRAGVAGRHGTMAWERQEDLLDLFRQNGIIFNGHGEPIIHGNVMCMYDRGIYTGYFTNLTIDEDDEHAFSFQINWEFKVRATVFKFPGSANSGGSTGFTFLNQSVASTQSLANDMNAAASAQASATGNGDPIPFKPGRP